MIEHTGWTWEYVDQHMTLPRLAALTARLNKNPPLRDMVQAYLGIKTDSVPQSKTENTEDDLAEFVKMFSAAGGKVG